MDEGRRRREGEKDGGEKEPGYVTSARERGEGGKRSEMGVLSSPSTPGVNPLLPPSLHFLHRRRREGGKTVFSSSSSSSPRQRLVRMYCSTGSPAPLYVRGGREKCLKEPPSEVDSLFYVGVLPSFLPLWVYLFLCSLLSLLW